MKNPPWELSRVLTERGSAIRLYHLLKDDNAEAVRGIIAGEPDIISAVQSVRVPLSDPEKPFYDEPLFFAAISLSARSVMQMLVELCGRGLFATKSTIGFSVLGYMVYHNHISHQISTNNIFYECVEWAIRAGADVDARDSVEKYGDGEKEYGDTPLFKLLNKYGKRWGAVSEKQHTQFIRVAELLLRSGADPEKVCMDQHDYVGDLLTPLECMKRYCAVTCEEVYESYAELFDRYKAPIPDVKVAL